MGNILSDQFGTRNPNNPEFYNSSLNDILFRKYIYNILINRTDFINGNEIHVNRRKAFCRTGIDTKTLTYTYMENVDMKAPKDNINIRLPGIYNMIQAYDSVPQNPSVNTITSRIDNFDLFLKTSNTDSITTPLVNDMVAETCNADVHEICAKQLFDNNCITINNGGWQYNNIIPNINKKCYLYNNNLNNKLETISKFETTYSRNNIILTDTFINKYDYLCNFLKKNKIINTDIGIKSNWGATGVFSIKANQIINGYSNNRTRQYNSSVPYTDSDYIDDVDIYINAITPPTKPIQTSQPTIPIQSTQPNPNNLSPLEILYNSLRNKIIINYLVINENLYKDPTSTGNTDQFKPNLNSGDTACACLNGQYGDNIKLYPKNNNPMKNSIGQVPNITELLEILNNYNTTFNTSNMRGAYFKSQFKIAQASLRYYYYYYDSNNNFTFAQPKNFNNIYNNITKKFYNERGVHIVFYYHDLKKIISDVYVNLNDPNIYSNIQPNKINMYLDKIIDDSGTNVLSKLDLTGGNVNSTVIFNAPIADLSKTNSIYSMKLEALGAFVSKDETADQSCYNNLYGNTMYDQLPYYTTTSTSGSVVTCVNTFNLSNINANSLSISDIIMNNTCGNNGTVTNFFPSIPKNSTCPTGGDPNGIKGQTILCLTGFNIDITNTNEIVPSLYSPFNGEYRSCNKTDVYCTENTYIKVSDNTIYLEFNYTGGNYNISLIKQINGALYSVVISKEFLYNTSNSGNNEEMCLSSAYLSLYILYLNLNNVNDPVLRQSLFESYMSANVINANYISLINTILNPTSVQQLIQPSGTTTISTSFINYVNSHLPSYIWLTNTHLASSLPTNLTISGIITTGPSRLVTGTGTGTGFLVSSFNYLDSYNFYIFSSTITDSSYGQGIFINTELANITPYMVIENFDTTTDMCEFLDPIPNTTNMIPNNNSGNCINIPLGNSGILNLNKIFSTNKPFIIYCPSIYRYLLIKNKIILGATDITNENIGCITSTHIKQSNLQNITDQYFLKSRYGLKKTNQINPNNEWLIVSYDDFILKLGAIHTQNIGGIQMLLTLQTGKSLSILLTRYGNYNYQDNISNPTIQLKLVNFKWIIIYKGINVYQSSNNLTDSIDFITNYINNPNTLIKKNYWTNIETKKTLNLIDMNIVSYMVIELEILDTTYTNENLKKDMKQFINTYFKSGNIIDSNTNINITKTNSVSQNSYILIDFFLLDIGLLSGFYRNSEFFIKEMANDVNLGKLITFNYDTTLISVSNAIKSYSALTDYNNLTNINTSISGIFTNNYTINLLLYSYDSFLFNINSINTTSISINTTTSNINNTNVKANQLIDTIRDTIYNSYIKIPEFNTLSPIRIQSIDGVNFIVNYMYYKINVLIHSTNNSLIGLNNLLFDKTTHVWGNIVPSLQSNIITPIGEFIGRIITNPTMISYNISIYINKNIINQYSDTNILQYNTIYNTLLYNKMTDSNMIKIDSVNNKITNNYNILTSYIDIKNTDNIGLINQCGNLPTDVMNKIIELINNDYNNNITDLKIIIDNMKSGVENFTISSSITDLVESLNLNILDNDMYDIKSYNYKLFLNLIFEFYNKYNILTNNITKLIKQQIDLVQSNNNVPIDPTLDNCNTINMCLINFNTIYKKLGGIDKINPPSTTLKNLVNIIIILVVVIVIGIIIIYIINITITDKRFYIKKLLSKLKE